jgi:hypothetical protein
MSITEEIVDQFSEEQLLAALSKKQAKKIESREAYKALVKETVPKALFKLCYLSEMISKEKQAIFEYFEQALELKNEVYGIKEKQQSHTFSTDNAEITIGFRVTDGWDDTVTAGIQKVNEFITSLAKDEASAALVDTIFSLLKKDAKGNLKSSRVLELQELTKKFNNPEFTDGVDIISKAYVPKRSSWFIEAYTIGENSKTSIPLSMSSVDFPAAYEFSFDKKKEAQPAKEAEHEQ